MAVTITFPDGSSLLVDASLRQNHEQTNDVTDHPVENGANVSDNIRPKPRTYTIEGVVSATPIVAPGEKPQANRHFAAYKKLEAAAASRVLLGVSSGLKKYTSMAIESFSTPREPEHGIDLYFSLTLKQIAFATTATTTVPKSALGTGATKQKTKNQASARVHRGTRQTTPATAAQTAGAKKAAGFAAAKPKPRIPPQSDWLSKGLNFITGQ